MRLKPASPLTALLLLLAAGSLLSGCDTIFPSDDEEEVCTAPVMRITGVEIIPIDRRGNSFVHSDTLRGQVAFQIEALSEQVGEREVTCVDDPRIDVMPFITTNPVRLGPRVLRFDRAIVARGERIEAGTNLMEVEALSDDYSLRRGFGPGGITEIHLDRETYELSPGRYSGYFEWVTAEGETETFGDSVEVYVDLQ